MTAAGNHADQPVVPDVVDSHGGVSDVDGVERAPRGSWAWWWAYTTSLVVLIAVLVAAAVGGQRFGLAIPAAAVALLGFSASFLGLRQQRAAPPTPAPREITRAMDRADPQQRRNVLREARRARTVAGPLAAASKWHRDHRFTAGGALRPPYGLGLALGMAANATAQLAGGGPGRSGIVVIWSIIAAGFSIAIVVGLAQYWVLLTHDVPRPDVESAP